jgi:RNA polymerase sigma factor (sigma-70 family)
MSSESVEPLLEQLSQGDMARAREVFLAYEPYLRQVVRRQLPQGLRAKFDSVDIVQSVWAHLLEGYRDGVWHFSDPRRFQAFLVQVTRNRFIDTFRKHRTAYQKEQSLGEMHPSQVPPAPQPRPSQLVAAEDLWERMLALCPEEHRQLLHLKRQGLPMEELTVRTGMHPGSIRRIFRNLASKLALQEGLVVPNEED